MRRPLRTRGRVTTTRGNGHVGFPVVVVVHVSFLRGGAKIERDELQQFVAVHLREQQLGAALQQILRQLPFRLDELVDLLLDRSPAHERVDEHILR